MAVIGALAAVPAPQFLQSVSLDTTPGRLLYVSGIVGAAILAIWTSDRRRKSDRAKAREERIVERDADRVEAAARETRAEERHELLQARFDALLAVQQSSNASPSLVQAITATQSLAPPPGPWITTTVDQPTQGTPSYYLNPVYVSAATDVLREIASDPPRTPEAVERAVSQLNHYVLKAEPASIIVTVKPARLIHGDKDGNIIGEA